MQPAANQTDPTTGSWRISREGAQVATVGMRSERGEVVVATDVEGIAQAKPYRFGTIEEADAFIGDLMTSFAFLGCDVVTN